MGNGLRYRIFEPFLWDPETQEFLEGASGTFSLRFNAIPEPSSIVMGLLGAGAMLGIVVRRRVHECRIQRN